MEHTPKDNYKWTALALLTFSFFLHQGTRQIFSAVLPQMKTEFASAMTASDWGSVMSVFMAVYGVCVFFAGVIGDLFSRKKVIVASVAVFSAGIFTSGFAGMGGISVACFFTAAYGVLFAIGQCALPSSSTSILTQLHSETRSTALSIWQSAQYFAVVLVSLAAGGLSGLGAGGWRRPFWIFGALGIAWAAWLAFRLRDTEQTPAAAGAPVKPSLKEALFAFVKKPSAWLLTLAFGMNVATSSFAFWTPVYIKDVFYTGTSGAVAASMAVFHSVIWHYVGGLIGLAIAGRLSDRLAPRFSGARAAVSASGLLLGGPCIFIAYEANSLALCCAGLFLFGIARGAYDTNMFAALHDVIQPRYRAAATGFMCFCGFLIGSVAPKMIGAAQDAGVSLKSALASLSVIYFCGGFFALAAALFFVKRDYEK